MQNFTLGDLKPFIGSQVIPSLLQDSNTQATKDCLKKKKGEGPPIDKEYQCLV